MLRLMACRPFLMAATVSTCFSDLASQGGSIKNDTISGNTIWYSGQYQINLEGADVHNILMYENSINNNANGGILITSYPEGSLRRKMFSRRKSPDSVPDSTVTGNASPGALIQIYADLSGQGKISRYDLCAG